MTIMIDQQMSNKVGVEHQPVQVEGLEVFTISFSIYKCYSHVKML